MGHGRSASQWSGKAFEEVAFKPRPEGHGGSAERKPVAQHSEQREQHNGPDVGINLCGPA